MLYGPGFNWTKLKRPASSVIVRRFDPVSVLMIVTVAPGRAAPLGSATVPTIALVVSPCPRRRPVQSTKDARQAVNRVVRIDAQI
jgi:hypothetical protein